MSSEIASVMRRDVERDGDSLVTDLHVWQVGAGTFAAIVSLAAHHPRPVQAYRDLFREHEELVDCFRGGPGVPRAGGCQRGALAHSATAYWAGASPPPVPVCHCELFPSFGRPSELLGP